MRADFDLAVVKQNGRATVFMFGEIDATVKQEIHDALLSAQRGSADVVVDLSRVTYIDSTGINALIRARRRATQGQFHLVGASPSVCRLFEITGVVGLLLDNSSNLTWQQITYHRCGWRQWMTVESAQDGAPIAEIIEAGPYPGTHRSRYRLEMNGQTALYRSLDDAMRAARDSQSATASATSGKKKELNV